MSTAVRPGQRWLHVPSGDVRRVVDVVAYAVASGGHEPGYFERDFGITHVARLVREDGRKDRRDSSDMLLVQRDEEMFPFGSRDWRLLDEATPRRSEGSRGR